MSRLVWCVCAILWVAPCMTRADAERFPFTYGWMTPPKGELELEIRQVQPASARFWQTSASVEIGVTERYTVEPYLVYNKSGGFRDVPATQAVGDADEGGGPNAGAIFDPVRNGAAYRYGGVRLEQRYRFGDYKRKRLLSSLYAEYENLRGGPQTLETKYIGQFDPTRQSTLVVNLVQETPVSRGGVTEWSYSLGGSFLADKRNDRFWYGAEMFGSWASNAHWAGPSAGFYLNSTTRIVGTYGRQYRGTGGDKFQIMLSRELN